MTEHPLENLEGIMWNENSCGEKFQNGKKNSEKPRENFWRGPNTFQKFVGENSSERILLECKKEFRETSREFLERPNTFQKNFRERNA